jgi:hypothetical protein
MTKDLMTNNGFTVGLGPGEAVEFRPGEVMGFPDDIANRLLKRPGVSVAPANADLYRGDPKKRALPTALAAMVSPPHDKQRLEEEVERKSAKVRLENLEMQQQLIAAQLSKLNAK